jgi:hypothetical protein
MRYSGRTTQWATQGNKICPAEQPILCEEQQNMPLRATYFLEQAASRDEFYKSQVFVNLAMSLLPVTEEAVRQ